MCATQKYLYFPAVPRHPLEKVLWIPTLDNIGLLTYLGIDDALAIFAALESHRRGEIQILAITLVNGNTHVHHQVDNVLRIINTVPQCFGNVRTQ